LLGEVEPVPAPPHLWGRIERAIAPAEAPGDVIAMRRKVRVWQGLAAATTALAASLSLLLLARPEPAPPGASAPMVAMLRSETGATRLVATFDPAAGMLVVTPAGLNAAPGQAHQLWVIPAGGRPRPMGMVEPDRPMRMKVPAPMMEAVAKATVAVSMEPAGGSPTGLPTGPVIARGRFSSI
jgi:anti-sigma-K factor RskA